MSSENILITGITGQDGIFLTSLLLKDSKKYNIIGLSRKNDKTFFKKINSINADVDTTKISLLNLDLKDKYEVSRLIKETSPAQIYNLTGPSSVYESIRKPKLYSYLIPVIFNNIVESCIEHNIFPSFFQASSSEMFSVENKIPLNEKSQYEPRSPYSMAKYQVFKSVNNLKQKYDWNIKNGIMFNHESEFRDEEYLFSKIIDAAIAIKNKKQSVLKVGSLTYVRDWSFAGDIAEAVASVNSYDDISDFVIGSGTGTSIQKLVEITFSELGLDYEDFIEVDSNLLRVGDPEIVISDPSKLKSKLGWYPKVNVEKLIQRCINFRTN